MTKLTQETLFSSNTQPENQTFPQNENERLAILKQHFPNCFDKHGAFLPDKMAEILHSDGIATQKEGYSLNWLGKSYARILKDTPPETLLAEDTAHNRQPENTNSENLLIKGDNLEVLKHLKNAYKNQIKMIYIDPPYNTGSDGFVYQDDRKFTPQQLVQLGGMDLDEAKCVLEFTAKKSNSHSAWLTFMYPRLYVARELLRDDGVIFISIDDNEQAQLKVLCDEVFGEENFVGQITVVNNSRGRDYGGVARMHEYIFVYIKNFETEINELENSEKIFPYSDEIGGFELRELRNRNIAFHKDNRPNLFYPFYVNENNKLDNDLLEISLEERSGFIPVYPKISQGFQTVWRWGREKSNQNLNTEIAAKKMQDGGFMIVEKYRKTSQMARSVWTGKEDNSEKGTLLVKSLFEGKKLFNFPKSMEMIKKIIQMGATPNSLIMDFFAGSGTTAHAVMQLNAEDKDNGNRRFICVQLPEKTDNKSEAFKAGYTTIFDITKARIQKASQKIKNENPDYSGDLGFKIFETVPNFQTALIDDFNPQQADLPNTKDAVLSDEQLHTLLTTWRVYDGSILPEKVQTIHLAGYTAYYCRHHLYLLASGFSSECASKP
ncbi:MULTISPECIES: DNA methyltransferase [unclassified Moraxella]|uniref:site-specific DNA-methyltransferase n=1 Tax=unclassified Moraxella TaxID=2685852 RepID=UPI00359E04E1